MPTAYLQIELNGAVVAETPITFPASVQENYFECEAQVDVEAGDNIAVFIRTNDNIRVFGSNLSGDGTNASLATSVNIDEIARHSLAD